MIPKKGQNTFSQRVGTVRILKGIETDELRAVIPAGSEVSPQPCSILPAEEENRGRCLPGSLIKFTTVKEYFYREAPLLKKSGRTPEAGAEGTVNQGQLSPAAGDQILNIGILMEKVEGVVNSNPAAAGGCRGPKTIAPLILGNIILIIDKIIHVPG